ncbi:MAG TPA: (2Fe-2S)-binding protein [Ignavibacteria bacterium]|nr:(2Fe-2S)-binding protein [Ignavibacteria bacterium]HMR40819.1 (2Fe-2S)-binding protein [Ignavibacteria bacterium]
MQTEETKYVINKCVCFDTTFLEMKNIMKTNDLKNIDELRKIKEVGTNCKLCVPYIEKMIITGQTEFNEIIS